MSQNPERRYPRIVYGNLLDILPVIIGKRRERFAAKIDRSAGADSCHPWLGAPGPGGYGLVQGSIRYEGYSFLAHRVAWALEHGREPQESEVIRHSCDNPPCCNARHLINGTQLDNMRDAIERGRARLNLGGCPKDHEAAAEAWRLRWHERMRLEDIAVRLGRHRSTIVRWTAPPRNPAIRR